MDKRLLYIIKKQEKAILYGISTGFIVFIFYLVLLYIPLYNSTAKLFVRNIPLNNTITSYGEGSTIKSESGYSNPLFNLKQLLKSEKVATKLYLQYEKQLPEDLKKYGVKTRASWIGKYSKAVNAKIEPSTDIIKIAYKWSNKKTAQKALNILITEFKNTNLELRKSIETKQREYLDTQLVKISNELDEMRTQIKDYKVNNKAIDVQNEITEITKARVSLEKQYQVIQSQISYNKKKMEDLCSQLNISNASTALRSTAIGEDPYLIKLNQQLSLAQQAYSSLSAKFTDQYPDVIAVKNEIELLENNIKTRQKESLGEFMVSRGIYDKPSQDIVTDVARVQAERVSLKAQSVSLEQGIKNLDTKIALLPSKKLGLEELQKQEKALADAYSRIKQKQMEAKIKENQIMDNIIVLSPPSSPSALTTSIVSKFICFILLGFFGAICFIWIKEDLNDRWVDSNEIEEVSGHKILGVIPWVQNNEDFSQAFIKKAESVQGIAFGNIAMNIVSKSYSNNAQSVMFISTNYNRGKSSIIPNITSALAKSNRSVVLIDTDFTNPARLLQDLETQIPHYSKDLPDIITEINRHKRLNQSIKNDYVNGLISQILIPITFRSKRETDASFNYLCATKEYNNINDFVSTQGFKTILEHLKLHYEIILIDTPAKPVIYPEFTSLIDITDSVVVISGMSTKKDILLKLLQHLKKMNTKVLGIIPREENSDIEKEFYAHSNEKQSIGF